MERNEKVLKKRIERVLFFCLVINLAFLITGCGRLASEKRIIRVSHAQSEAHPEHLGLLAFKEYEEQYYLEQYAVITEEQCQIYNLWNHAFSKPEIEKDLHKAGFGSIEIYGDVSGNELTKDSTTMCITAFK